MSDRVRDAFGVLMERMEDPPSWEEVRVPVARPEKPRSRRPFVAMAAAVVVVLVVGVLAVNLLRRPVAYQLPTVDVAAGETVVSKDPLVVVGTPAPEPRFDTSTLGDEVELNEVSDIAEFLAWVNQAELQGEIQPSKMVVGGSIESGSSVGIAVGAPETPAGEPVWCLLTLAANGAVCATSADFETPVYSARHPSASTGPGALAWGPAPLGTSVVTLNYADISLWQKPVSGVVLFGITAPLEDYQITAFDQQGNELHSETGPATGG